MGFITSKNELKKLPITVANSNSKIPLSMWNFCQKNNFVDIRKKAI